MSNNMLVQIFTTWTIYILLPFLNPSFSLGAAFERGENEGIEPKTMYDAVAKMCPNLEKTVLKENEIFTKKCLNWAEINATSSFSTNAIENVQCLVLYEAVLSFCEGMGDAFQRVTSNIIPTTSELKRYNYTLNSVCDGNLYPLNKTQHNISHLLSKPNVCYALCLDNTNYEVSDICKFAYFFTNFNVNKFIRALDTKTNYHSLGKFEDVHKLDAVKQNSSVQSLKAMKIPQVQSEPVQIVQDDPSKNIGASASDPKSENAETNNGNKNDLPQNDLKQELKPEDKHAKEPVDPETELKIPRPPVLQQDVQNKTAPIVPSVENNHIAENIDQLKQPAKAADSPPEAVPKKDKIPEVKGKLQEDAEEYDDKSQGVNVDGADPELEEGEVEQEEGDTKAVIPEEPNEAKTSSKRIKPSTVEDEAINAFNTPEDDMDGDSYFFSYFTVIMCLFIVGYVGYHNRQKILALILEGKKGRRSGRGRRPNSANYHKLDTNLEEAISSSCTKSASNVIY